MLDNRNIKLDILKGIAIFLVIVGHSIQYLSQGSFDFFSNSIFIFIYSFHMPLFMLISGYLFYNSIDKGPLKETFKYKFKQLIYPIFIFTVLNYYITEIIESLIHKNFIGLINAGWIGRLGSIWFLWSVLSSISIILLVHYITKNNILKIFLLIILSPIVYLFPNGDNNLFMYGFFIIGFLFNKYKNNIPISIFKLKYIISIIFIIMIIFFWNRNYYIYLTGMFNFSSPQLFIQQLLNDFYRFVYGLLGSIFIITLVDIISIFNNIVITKIKNIFAKLGKISLQIYLVQNIVIENIFNDIYSKYCRYIDFNVLYQNKFIFNIVVIPIISVLFTIIIVNIIKILNDKKISKYLFGR